MRFADKFRLEERPGPEAAGGLLYVWAGPQPWALLNTLPSTRSAEPKTKIKYW